MTKQEIKEKLNIAIENWNKTKHNKFYNQIVKYSYKLQEMK